MFKNKTLFFRYYLYFDFLHGFPPPKKRPSAEPEYSITAFSTNGHGRKMQNGNKTPALHIIYISSFHILTARSYKSL